MRKVDPAGVLGDFNVSAREIIDHFDRVAAALVSQPTRESDISRTATQSFLALFVAFERFCSDLLLAYLNRDFSRYQADVTSRLAASVTAKFGGILASRIAFNTMRHVTVTELESIVDPTGWNLTFSTVAELKDYANQHLATGHASRIASITASEAQMIDTARAVRNFIAHQSEGSKRRMNEALSTVEAGTHNRHLGRMGNSVNNVGAYLKANTAGGRRLHLYGQALRAVAAKM